MADWMHADENYLLDKLLPTTVNKDIEINYFLKVTFGQRDRNVCYGVSQVTEYIPIMVTHQNMIL